MLGMAVGFPTRGANFLTYVYAIRRLFLHAPRICSIGVNAVGKSCDRSCNCKALKYKDIFAFLKIGFAKCREM